MSIQSQPFFIRMKDELDDLRDKKMKLAKFVSSAAFDSLDFDMREAMNAQLGAMAAYDFALVSRLTMLLKGESNHTH